MEDEYNNNDSYSYNQYRNVPSTEGVLQIRLDTNQLLYEVRKQLSGIEFIEIEKDGETQLAERKISRPLANKLGVSSLMSYITTIINPQTVQGNYDLAEYRQHIKRCRIDLMLLVTINRIEWDIKQADLHLIANMIMNVIKPYLSRLKDNKERESYTGFNVSEHHNVPTKKGFGLFN